MAGSPPITVLSGVRHATIDRTLRLLGFGDASLKTLQTNDRDALDPAALESALRGLNGKAALVLLQARDVNTGGFDDLEALIPIARKYGAWTDVDGAFGMWVAFAPDTGRPVSTSLRGGVRFLSPPLPASPSSSLAAFLPSRGRYGLTLFRSDDTVV